MTTKEQGFINIIKLISLSTGSETETVKKNLYRSPQCRFISTF